MPKVRITTSQTVRYDQEKEMTEEELQELIDTINTQDSLSPDDIGIDTRDVMDGDDIDEVELFIENNGTWKSVELDD